MLYVFTTCLCKFIYDHRLKFQFGFQGKGGGHAGDRGGRVGATGGHTLHSPPPTHNNVSRVIGFYYNLFLRLMGLSSLLRDTVRGEGQARGRSLHLFPWNRNPFYKEIKATICSIRLTAHFHILSFRLNLRRI